mmetsp:Transcript_15602/g.35926  ORF Transcript_15602/g.35926 Transcript_15602/m.35926 type:complete len:275 (+) Transcript_15602:252-1076(+)
MPPLLLYKGANADLAFQGSNPRQKFKRFCLPRDQKPILAVDELSSLLHPVPDHLVQNTLGSLLGRHGSLDIPYLLVLGRHLRPVEARMEHEDRVSHVLHLLAQELGRHVARRPAHMVSVVAPSAFILSRPPLDAACLARDDDELAPLRERLRLDEGVVHPERPQGAHVDLLHLFLEVERALLDKLARSVEVPRVVDDNIERAAVALDSLRDLQDGLVVRDVDAVVDVPLAHEPLDLGGARPADHDGRGAYRNQLLDDRQSKATVSSSDQYALPA